MQLNIKVLSSYVIWTDELNAEAETTRQDIKTCQHVHLKIQTLLQVLINNKANLDTENVCLHMFTQHLTHFYMSFVEVNQAI